MKILLTLLLLFATEAQAKSILHDLTMEEIKAKYNVAIKTTPDEEKIFIPANVVFCSSKKGLLKVSNYSISHNGVVNTAYARSVRCYVMDGWSVGIVAEVDKEKNMMHLVFRMPMSDGEVDYGYFYQHHLMTIAQRKALSKNL